MFSVDDIENGSVIFWGIKNYTQIQGFEVYILPSSDIVMDPVSCLRTYLTKTVEYRNIPENPLLISLKAPYNIL